MEIYKENDVYVISDEIWSDLVLHGNQHIPTQSVSEDAKNRTVAQYAPSKTFNLAGMVGSYHIIYNKYIRERVEKESSLCHYNSINLLSMYALMGAYCEEGAEWTDELREVLGENVTYACDFIEAHFNNYLVVSIMLIVYGIFFILIENYNKKRTASINSVVEIGWKTAFLIGVFQLLAVIPGTSRSGATIIGGILLGTSRTVAAEYTFFLAIPTMFGASLLKLVKFGLNFTGTEAIILIVGTLVSFVVSILAIKFLMGYIKKHDFKVFGWYRIALGIVVLLFFSLFR